MLLVALLAPWAAMAQQALPYSYGFEDNDLSADGWTTQNPSGLDASEFGISENAKKTGDYGFRFSSYDDEGDHTQYLISPELNATTGVVAQFYYRASSGSGIEKFKVGYSTTNTDIASFNFGSEISTSSTSWTQSAEFTFPAGTKYVAIYYYSNYQYRLFVDDLTFEAPAPCPKPTGLTCTTYTATTATLSWTAGGSETAWMLQYGTDNTFATGTYSEVPVSTNPTQLTGLTAETTYYARVKADCGGGDQSEWSNVCEFKPSAALIIGNGTSTDSYIPLVGNYKSSYDQMIYTASQLQAVGINAAGSITKIGFNSSAANTYARNVKIYMGHTDKTSFSSNTDFIAYNDLQLVYDYTAHSQWSIIAGWNDFELDTPFDYDGSSNLVIAVHCGLIDNFYSSYFYYTATSSNQVVYAYSDSYDPVPSTFDPSSYSGYKSTTTRLPNLKLFIEITSTPKPRNIQVSDITASQATVSWEAPATGTPTGYQFQIKVAGEEWPTTWINAENNLSVEPTGLTASTNYVVRVRAVYAEGESGSIETEFRTLDACAFPTNFTATTVPGVGTDANFSWVKGYDETAWNLQLATDVDFNNVVTTYFTDDGFVVDGNNVTFHATGLTPEQTYFARVQADCGGSSTSVWSNVETFTPSNYVDYTFGNNATSTTSYVPFYGYYANYGTLSQFIITASNLAEVSGGIIRRMTFHTSTASASWGDAVFDVYVKEVEATSFNAANANALEDWTSMTNVYSGSLSVSGSQMVINFTEPFSYNGGNLMIGFNETTLGTGASVSWYYVSGQSNAALYGYKTYSYYSSSYEWSYSRTSNIPKITFNYQPTPYKYPVIDEANCAFGTTSAHIAWTVTGATPTGYQYQYKPASATEWPSAWTSVTTAYADLSGLTPGSFYDFRVKALYDGGNESVAVDYSFFTECAAITAFPWKETFESYPANTSVAYDETYKFDHPCWVNEHLVDGTGSSGSMTLFQVCSALQNGNSTHKLQLPDMKAGTVTGLRLPEMTLASGTDYQFVLDINRNTDSKPTEGIRVFVSTNGELEGATELCFISRDYTVASAPYIPAEEASGWYTYELPLGIQGTCYIILRGESQYGSATYMDNLIVEEIPTCARPKDLAYSNVTNHSAKLSWTAGDTEQTLWQVAYSKTTFDPNTASFDVTTVNTVDATANPFVLAGLLDAASTYYVYVRANCGTAAERDFGPWSRKGISFTTLAATPAPSNFVASNPASAKVDLVWNAGGGDFESWELYYVASETAPEAPTATTTATVSNITPLPTTEAPYVLEGLNPVTKYFAWIRAKHVWDNETTYSDWVALTSSYFETLDACPTPTDLVATNLTSVSADLSWVGSDDVTEGYTVEYGEEGTYSLNETVDFSGLTPVNYNATGGELPEGWYSYNTSTSGFAPRVSSSSNYSYISGLTDNFLLMTTNAYSATDPSANQYAYAIMPQYSNLGSVSFDYQYENISYGTLTVGYVTNNEGYTTYQVLETPTKASGKQTWSLTATHIATINNANGYVAFRYESGNGTFYSVGIDNVTIKGGTYTPGATQTVPSEGTSITIDGLTPDKTYTVKVKSNCTSGEYCEPISFTTLAEGNKVFTNAANDGKWGNDNNWMPTGAPAITENAILRANATIESGCEAEAKKITFEGTPTRTLTIADGGQLKTDNTVTATVKKTISAYTEYTGEYNGGYYLISTPLDVPYGSASTYGMITDNLGSNATPATSTYDLYNWSTSSSSATYDEWRNYRASTFSIANGTGYLYASKNGVELTFTGAVKANNTDVSKTPSYTTSGTFEFNGWNLYANPFVCDAYINDVDEKESETPMAFYRMNEQGDGYVAATGAIHPMEGIFVQATKTGQSFNFSREYKENNSRGQLNINLSKAGTRGVSLADNAIVRFGEGSTLEKFSFRENSSKVYIPMEGKDYAVINAGQTGEIPVSFKAEKNGSYNLSFTCQEVSFSYLHLIDNMTGADVDLLANPSYSFSAQTTDYASRFRLVFATGSSTDGDNFGFINGMGNLCIFGIDGTATLQVIDVTGRMLSSETFSGSYEKRLNVAPGVYMLRLINGNDVKVQKMVVR